jgi:hypothetical protein
MKTTVITISEDVINSVVRPVSMFLNDIEEGVEFTHVLMQKSTEYSLDDDKFPIFTFASSKGGVYKFTMYDLKRFKFDTKMFMNHFLPENGVKATLTLAFKVLKCEPTLIKDTENKMYPPFCYEGFEEFSKVSKAIREKNAESKANDEPATARIPQEEYTALFASEIKDGFEDKFYRTLTVDKPLITYPKGK